MPRPATERPLAESMTVVLRLKRQLDLSTKLSMKRKKIVKEALCVVMDNLQAADRGKP